MDSYSIKLFYPQLSIVQLNWLSCLKIILTRISGKRYMAVA